MAANLFFSCDWGTSRLRLRLVEFSTCRVLAELNNERGAKQVGASIVGKRARANAFSGVMSAAIHELVGDNFHSAPIVVSGMATSSFGWHELPYARLPFAVDGTGVVTRTLRLARHTVCLVSGVCGPDDVMRGEETQLIGLLADDTRHNLSRHGLIMLPGTHSKHVRLRSGKVVAFETHVTGELYGWLTGTSTMRGSGAQRYSNSAFGRGVSCAVQAPISAAVFKARARALLGLQPAFVTHAFLSGVLIGAEVRSALRNNQRGPFLIAGTGRLGALYRRAFQLLGSGDRVVLVSPRETDAAVVAAHAALIRKAPFASGIHAEMQANS